MITENKACQQASLRRQLTGQARSRIHSFKGLIRCFMFRTLFHVKKIATWPSFSALAIVLATVWFAGALAWSETPALPESMKQDAQGKFLLIDFYTEYCGTCQMMAPKLKLMQRKTRDQIVFKHIDVADDSNKKYWDSFQLKGTPTYVLYNAEGQPIYKMQELITPVILEKQLLRHTRQLKSIELPTDIQISRLAETGENGALNRLLLLAFESDDCKPCQEMTPFLNGFEMGGKPNLTVIRLNSKNSAAKKLMAQLNIKATPAYALLDNALVSPASLANNRRGELFVMTGKVPPRMLWDVIRMFGESGV